MKLLFPNLNLVTVAYAAQSNTTQSRGKGRDMRQVQCFSCKQGDREGA